MVVDIRAETNCPVVVSVLAGRPAALCGQIKVGDQLIAVDQHSTRARTLAEVREMILGPRGSAVLLRFEGPSGGYECTLIRGGGETNGSVHSDKTVRATKSTAPRLHRSACHK